MTALTDHPDGDPLLSSRGVCAMFGGIARETLFRWRQRDFPPPDATINGRHYWHVSTAKRYRGAHSERTE